MPDHPQPAGIAPARHVRAGLCSGDELSLLRTEALTLRAFLAGAVG